MICKDLLLTAGGAGFDRNLIQVGWTLCEKSENPNLTHAQTNSYKQTEKNHIYEDNLPPINNVQLDFNQMEMMNKSSNLGDNLECIHLML